MPEQKLVNTREVWKIGNQRLVVHEPSSASMFVHYLHDSTGLDEGMLPELASGERVISVSMWVLGGIAYLIEKQPVSSAAYFGGPG